MNTHEVDVDLSDLDALIAREEQAISEAEGHAPSVTAMLHQRDREISELRAALAEKTEAAERTETLEIEAFIRDGRDAGKITSATAGIWREDAAENLERARRRLASSPVLIDRAGPQPPLGAVLGSKLWEDHSVEELSKMKRENPEEFEALLEEHRARRGRR